jgi:ABC-2 type transport system ATP-binding protein
LIEVHDLSKSYGGRPAVDGISFSVPQGEILGFLGPNGAGKSTTMRILTGYLSATAGTASVAGFDVFKDPLEVRRRIGYLPENPYFYDHLTAEELLEYLAQLSGVEARERKRRVQEMLSHVGLTESSRMQLRKFSKGMLQRVGIAQAILHQPQIVFLDEPMSGLDPIGRREVRDLIQRLKDEGKTVFFSTHILSDAESLCDRVAVIHKGELRGIGEVAELASRVTGQVEILWQGAAATPAIVALGAEVHATGETVRATLSETQMDAAIDAIRRARARLIAVTPVRSTLEDYFVERLGPAGDSVPHEKTGARA